MTVTLNINNDTELRSHIKDCIKGQVLAIARSEFTDLTKEEIKKKVALISTNNFDYLLQSAFQLAAKNIIVEKCGIVDWDNSFLKPTLEKVLTERITKAINGINWDKLVNDLAREKVKSLIQ
jgi:hypothetical protein